MICDRVYCDTPVYINEMVNKHKPSSAISMARVNFLTHLLHNSSEPNLGFEDGKFPPEKTIYLTLLHNTGIHKHIGKEYFLDAPNEESFMPLWRACEEFLDTSKEKPRKLGDLVKILRSRPFKLKQGVIDMWLPAFLIIKRMITRCIMILGYIYLRLLVRYWTLCRNPLQDSPLKLSMLMGLN